MPRQIDLAKPLTLEHIAALTETGTRTALSNQALRTLERTHRTALTRSQTEIVYGLNTGFGPMAETYINPHVQQELQYNLIRSHACGVGAPCSTHDVRAMMLVRARTLARGHSAVHPDVLTCLTHFLNHGITPIVPYHGSVGASGDLVQLAHIALALIGEGTVSYQGKQLPAKQALKVTGGMPLTLRGRDGLALINGTAAMTGIAANTVIATERLFAKTITLTGMLYAIAGVNPSVVAPAVSELRGHRGQAHVASLLRQAYRARVKQPTPTPTADTPTTKLGELPQAIYSLRCVPQVLGPIYETLERVKETVSTELNAVTDNPLFTAEGTVLHNGNFHGDYIATAMDQLRAALTKWSMLAERQINFLANPRLNGVLPPYLNAATPGLTLAFQAAQFVATSSTATNQTLALPMAIHSIPTNNDNQDIVSMGCDSANLTKQVHENTATVVAILSLLTTQATELLPDRQLSAAQRAFVADVRRLSPPLSSDRPLGSEIESIRDWLIS